MTKMKKNLFISACAAALVLAGASCSKDGTLLSDDEGTATTKVVIREILTVETDTVGQLADKIGSKYESVQKLIVSGPIDATDVRTIRDLPELLSLDLKDATICGGDSTYTANNSTHKLYDNIIGEYMFYRTNLSEIVLPDNIVEIDPYAFYNLTGSNANPFSEIEIPEGVSVINERAFESCTNLTTVKLPSTLREIEDYVFYCCTSLNSINLEDSLERIGQEAFYYCTSLQQIKLPASLTTLGYRCFYNSGLTSIELPNSLVTFEENEGMGAATFYQCSSLQSVIFPSGMISTPPGIFHGCTSLTSVTFPDNLEEISSSTFKSCTSLKSVNLPSTLKTIGWSAFESAGLETVEIPDNVEQIENQAFFNCTSLRDIKLPANLTSINSDTFRQCYSLINITFPSALESLGDNVFYDCTALTNITLPSSLENIGSKCFNSCSSLTSVSLSENLKELPTETFNHCGKLTAITIPESVTSIGSSCFSECTNLSDVTLPESLETIENIAFQYCTSLTTITIPQNVTSVGSNIFNYCQNLTSIFWNTSTTVPRLFSSSNNSSSSFVKNPYCLLYLANASTDVSDGDIKNIIINGVADEIVLSSEMGNFHVPQEFKANKLTYTREFTYPTYPGEAAGWRSISLPFTVQTITGPEGQTLAPFNAGVEGAKPFWLRRLTANGFEDVTTIEAGVPYIIAMPNNEAYQNEYNISGTVTFTATSGAGITVPATGSDNTMQDVGPEFAFNCNYNYHTANAVVWALNESTTDGYAGSVFVRNERAVMPFEGYVSSSTVTTGNAPYLFRIDANTASTRSKRPLGPVPSIDDM